MRRILHFNEMSLTKGRWSSDEDRKLITYINRYRIWNWSEMAKAAGLSRSGKSCRLRWLNYLRPNLKHGNFTEEEKEKIFMLHQKHGNRWAVIVQEFPGRTDNEIKNFYNTTIRRLLKNKPTSSTPIMKKHTGENGPSANISIAQVYDSASSKETSSSSPEIELSGYENIVESFQNIGFVESIEKQSSFLEESCNKMEDWETLFNYSFNMHCNLSELLSGSQGESTSYSHGQEGIVNHEEVVHAQVFLPNENYKYQASNGVNIGYFGGIQADSMMGNGSIYTNEMESRVEDNGLPAYSYHAGNGFFWI